MRGLRFAVAVGLTSLVLVAAIGVAGFLAVRSATANAPWMAGAPFGSYQGLGGQNLQLPPEIQGLRDVPPSELFGHFAGVQVSLKDKDNKPFTLNVVPGTVTAADAGSLTIAANDGTTKSFTLNEQTVIRSKQAQPGSQAASPSPASGDQVVVVTLNNETTARAVIDGGKDGFTAGGFGGPQGWGGWGPWHR
jgi:hypothetical protein